MKQDGGWKASAFLKILRGWEKLTFLERLGVEVEKCTGERRKALPPFNPAERKGDLGKGRPISIQTKVDFERALALAGIS